jgi:CheY-like chemotaxis protein
MRTILVVDDEKLIRWSLCEALRKDFVVFTAESAEEALNVLGRAPVDAVVTDLRMPGMGGVDFVAEARRRFPDLAIFTISAYATDSVVRLLRSMGVRDCLSKPFDAAELRGLLHRHLDPSVIY